LESQIILVLGSKTTKGLILPMPVGVEKIKNKNTTLSEQVQISTNKNVKRGKIDLPNTQIHDRALS
jgi:putative transposon-encoded protein